MKRIIWILVLAALGWYGWGRYQANLKAQRAAEAAEAGNLQVPKKKAIPTASTKAGDSGVSFFTCDGRTACVQMTSCEEAKFFLQNCPGMNPSASREGISCEKQWCK